MNAGASNRSAAVRQRILSILTSLHLLLPIRAVFNWIRYVVNLRVQKRNAEFLATGAPDGLPLPSPFLIHEVSGVYDQKSFYDNGVDGAECIRRNLKKNNLAVEQFHSLLDFGCGCGRILRHWRKLPATKVYGTDYNPSLVKWCRENLPFAQCSVNTFAPRLEYANQQFDFIYAISVFTHLTEDLQPLWRDELYRVLKPGGYCLFTFQGTHHQDRLTPDEQDRFRSGRIVVQQAQYAGMNTCQVFHPESYVRGLFSMGAEVVDVIEGGGVDAGYQDAVIVRKR